MSSNTTPRLSATVRGSVESLAVVFGDQLDARSGTVAKLDRDLDAILMMEVETEATHVRSHRQRTVLFLSAMRHYALDRLREGHRVRYIRLNSPGNTQSFDGEVERAVRRLSPSRIVCTAPGEWRVRRMVERWEKRLGLPVVVFPDEHFSASLEDFRTWAEGRKQLVMEYFYREQRRRLGVLLDEGGQPTGGRWNLDAENRESFRKKPSPPAPYRPRPDAITREVMELVERRLPDAPGRLDDFRWPVTRQEARRALHDFVENRLGSFGRYQDAMWTETPWLYHSLLSPALNLKLLGVQECVEAALSAFERGDAPLNSVEGFVRQLIGWREFIRGVYWTEGESYGSRNFLGEAGSLPDLYWTGETDMVCLRDCVGQVLRHGYGHHIQRLMVTGNFALIAGVHPREITDWYLAMYVDAVDWVTTPNTLGMVMHADGGVVGTKPYAASGRYIDRMSNYCSSCRYDPGRRVSDGDDEAPACPFSTLYWDFLIRHEKRFRANRRMAMVLGNLDRLSAGERAAITSEAEQLRGELGVTGHGGDGS